MMGAEEAKKEKKRELGIAVGLSLCAAIAFYFSTKATLHDLDYTSQIASALLHGHVGLREKPPDWLNEMIPWQGKYYSAFPLGAVLSMLPVALLRETGLIQSFPGRVLAALIAGLSVYFFFGLAKAFGNDYCGLKGPTSARLARRIMLALFPIFGTWTWCNLGFGGAWQIALGLAVLGQAAALYYTLVRPSPFVAGAFFTLAFGNRTELLITLPLYLYFLWRQPHEKMINWKNLRDGVRGKLPDVDPFPKLARNARTPDCRLQLCAFPFHFRLWLHPHPGSARRALVSARLILNSRYSVEYLYHVIPRL